MPNDDLVATYWRHYRLSISGGRGDRLNAGDDFWAWEQVEQAAKVGGSEAIALLSKLADAAPDEAGLAYLGAGPIEELVQLHGVPLKDQIEEASRQNPSFANALQVARPT